MALDWALVASRCPQAALLDPAEQALLEQVIDKWCGSSDADLAHVYLARHLVLVEDMAVRGVLGSATSETLGPSSTSTTAASGVLPPDHWGLTSWGTLYLDLKGPPGPELI